MKRFVTFMVLVSVLISSSIVYASCSDGLGYCALPKFIGLTKSSDFVHPEDGEVVDGDASTFTVTATDGSTIDSNELIIRNGNVFAMDIFTLQEKQVKSADTYFTIIVPDDKGGLKQYSKKFKKWVPCSVVNGVYNADNFDQDTINYHLNPNNPF